MRSRILGVVVLWLLTGCSTPARMRPSPAAQVVVSKDGRIAAAEDKGVRLVASADTWKGDPSDLPSTLTPVELALENTSGRILRIQYEGFTLVGGAHYAALQPNTLARPGTTLRGPTAPPSYNPQGRFTRDPEVICYSCGNTGLPTVDMLRQAFPEGVLKNESSWTGFLYFESLGADERQVTLEARLVDASTGETFTTLRIPFQVLASSH
ncbi:hypothetical protein [Archangium sp.]|uniref:hypothetical protein n=1 Tax=Archangium sp. TaxID=1872627 RepID=UPI00389AD664